MVPYGAEARQAKRRLAAILAVEAAVRRSCLMAVDEVGTVRRRHARSRHKFQQHLDTRYGGGRAALGASLRSCAIRRISPGVQQ